MARLLDRATLADISGNAAYLDSTRYGDGRLAAILSAVDSSVCAYLRFTPYLMLHAAEEGVAQYLGSGDFAGRYLIELQHRPLVPGTAAQIFTSLELRYALGSVAPSTVSLDLVQVDHGTARAYV